MLDVREISFGPVLEIEDKALLTFGVMESEDRSVQSSEARLALRKLALAAGLTRSVEVVEQLDSSPRIQIGTQGYSTSLSYSGPYWCAAMAKVPDLSIGVDLETRDNPVFDQPTAQRMVNSGIGMRGIQTADIWALREAGFKALSGFKDGPETLWQTIVSAGSTVRDGFTVSMKTLPQIHACGRLLTGPEGLALAIAFAKEKRTI